MSSDQQAPELNPRTIRLADLTDKTVREKVLVCHQIEPCEVVRCAVELDATQIIQDTNPHFPTELTSALEMLDNPRSFFDLPFSTVLSPTTITAANEQNLILCDIAFNQTGDKERVLSAVEGAVTALARPQSLTYDVKLVADELFMNALYNAPVGSHSPKVNRSVNVELPPGKTCRLALGRDEGRLVLLCEDSFGSLEMAPYLARLLKCYTEGVRNAMNWGMGGAGIGCYMIFESCMSIYLGVKPNEKTLIACVFALGKGTRARQEMSKSIHYTKS